MDGSGSGPERPLERSFWVVPGVLLAGRYPGEWDAHEGRYLMDRFHELKVTKILNLTSPGERQMGRVLPAYPADPARIEVVRLAITDASVPSPEDAYRACRILSTWIEQGHRAYVHCFAGWGRTGTIVAALIGLREGLPGEAAIQRLRELRVRCGWEDMGCQTLEQEEFVTSFLHGRFRAAPVSSALTYRERIRGALLGLAIGDALGAGVEGLSADEILSRYPQGLKDVRGGGSKGWEPGETTEDTALALHQVESYVACRGLDIVDVGRRMQAWLRTGPRDAGGLIREVLLRAVSPADLPRVAEEVREEKGHRMAAGNGALTRVVPVGLLRAGSDDLERETRTVCSLIHHDALCQDTCVVLTRTLQALMRGESRLQAIQAARSASQVLHPHIGKELESIVRAPVRWGFSGGYTLDTLALSLQALYHSWSFEEGLLDVIHRGGDTDSNGAVTGALLGAYFGEPSIPRRWITSLRESHRVLDLAEGLAGLRESR